MSLAAALQDLLLTDRLSDEEDRNILFADFDGMAP
jgi:propionate CoA-transferase